MTMELTSKKFIPVLDSKNGILHAVLAAAVVALMLFGVEESVALALTAGVASLIGEIRGIIGKGLKFAWTWNSLAYLAVILTVVFPAFAKYFDLLPDLGEAIANQNWAKVVSLVLLLFNMLTGGRGLGGGKKEEDGEVPIERDRRGR